MKIWRKRNFKDFHILSSKYTASNFKILIFKHHAMLIKGLCVTFREQNQSINTKVLGKDRKQKNHCELK